MLKFRRTGALIAAAAIGAGFAAAAPVTTFADEVTGVTGCTATFTLSAGQTAECSFVYMGLRPGSDSDYTDSVGAATKSGLVQARLEAPLVGGLRQVIDHCETLVGACIASQNSSKPQVPIGSTVYCVVEALSPGVSQGDFICNVGI